MLPLNTTLQGRYQIVAQIGRGGMGAVYKAIDTRLRNTVALKQTLIEGEVARRAFEREAQLLAGMRHPALPKVSDHFTDELGQFLVMEFISGEDLGTMLLQRGEPFGVEEVLSWGDRLLDALEYLHTHNPPIVHRDIKPQNMKLTDRGEIILLDFGLAKGSSSAQATRSASTGSIFGYTPHYAPLEQIQGTGTGPRSDLYALSATLYNLLTGSPPPDALTRAAARINDEPDPLQLANQLNPEVPAAVATVLYQGMAQKPDQRPESAAAMRRMLRDAARGTMPVTIHFPEPATGETVVAPRPGTVGLPTIGGQIANGTTINQPPGTASTKPLPGSQRPAWLFPAIGGGVVAILLAVLFATGVFGGGGKPPTATPVQSTPAVVAGISTSIVDTPVPTVDLGSAVEQTIVARETATVAVAASQTAVIQAFIASANGTNTAVAQATIDSSNNVEKTALAETAAVIALTPTSTIAPPTNTRGPTNTPRPTATRDPNAPTATIRPTATPKAPETPTLPPPPPGGKAAVLAQGGGTEFRGSASVGTIDPASGDGGSCIQGSVTAKDGSFFNSFLVGIDQGGRLTKVNYNYGSGFFGACGLSAGEWGIVVYKAGNKDTNPGDQGQHQVRVRLSGTPGEVVYVKFRANEFDVPQPTTTPLPSPYDGQWSGTISGKTAGDQDFTGRFRMEVRANAIYRISIDGPSCLFETYPNVEITDNSFATGGSPTNPATGTDSSIQYTITGSFSSASRASGRANANQNGGSCIIANWSASK